MKKTLLMSLVLMLTLFQTVLAQTRTIAGRVTDQKTGEALPGTTVLLKGTTTGVSSDSDGRFNLQVPATGGTLVVSSVGMVTQEVAIGTRNTLEIVLAADNKQLSEVVVTGYGQQQERRDVTGGVVTVKGSDFQDQPIIGADQALQGRAAGVQVIQNSGTPGSGVSVRVRGPGSISASNEPLYVIDGLPINTGNYSQLGLGNQQTNALSDLNPNDIASIEVLKEASAAAIYGSRATNGVVLITTKRGQAGRNNVTLDYYSGIQNVWKRPDVLTGPQQVQLFLDMVQNRYPRNAAGNIVTGSGAAAVTWRSYADLANATFASPRRQTVGGITSVIDDNTGVRDLRFFQDPSTAPSTNWADQIFRTARLSNYGLTFSGGNDRTRYRVATSYFDQDGTIIGSGYKRASARLSLDNNLSTKVRMGTSIGLSRGTNIRINNDNNINGVLSAAILVASDIPVFRPDGTYAKDPGGSTENPVVAGTEPYIRSVSDRLIGSYYAEFELIKSLKYRATFGLDYLALNDQRFLPTTTNTGAGVNGQATEANATDVNFNHISSLSYDHVFGENHSFSALAVVEYQQDNYHDSFLQATGFPSNAIRQLLAGATKVSATSSATSWNFFGSLIKLNYAFKDKYLASATLRRDGSSRFGTNNRYGYFPAASVGWRISQENFMKNQTAASELKLRASYGQTGNSSFGLTGTSANFVSRGLISPGANYLGAGGLYYSQLANPDLKWERTESYNLGLDVGFLQNRLYLSGDIYLRKTSDLLLDRPLTSDTGYISYFSNVGNMENKGLELALTTINLRSDNPRGFNWETNFNITFNRNKITALVDNNPIATGFASRLQVGQPLGAFYGYRVQGIFQSQDEINAANAAAGGVYQANAAPGDIRFRDLNNDGRLDATNDQEIIGNAQPKYYGGITNTVHFVGFDLSVLFQYNVGNQIYNNTRAFSEGMNTVFGQSAAVLNRWTTTNTNTAIPRAVFGDPNNNRRTSDRFLEDGSYGRIKLVTLGYNLPKSVYSLAHLTTARIYLQAQNLVTFTKYSGLDPEVNTFSGTNQAANAAPGTDFLTYPQARTLTAGVTLGF